MRNPPSSWLFLTPFLLILSASIDVALVSGQCLNDQQSLLLQLKGSLRFRTAISTRLVTWNQSEDCCSWNGVGCDTSGRVISLELNGESIAGGIENSTALFSLQYLEKLNLAFNNFNATPIPSGISNLTNLVHLNLSTAGFVGQIPMGLSNLRKLIALDLSTFSLSFQRQNQLKLQNPNLKSLVQNLQNLEELYLDSVDISAQRSEWCQVLASSLPSLTTLSLRDCQISGPIDASLSVLHTLSVIRLDMNNLSAPVPDFFAAFPNLRTLTLSSCNLLGIFPGKIFQVPTLQNLVLSNNKLLKGGFHQFPHNSSLRTIAISGTNFSGPIPGSISNLRNLSWIKLFNCRFSGPIPPAIGNLTELVYLDFSANSFNGSIPSFQSSKNLSQIDLSRNSLTGSLSPAHFGGLLNLAGLGLGFNSLNGIIPSYIFALPSLRSLVLSNNQISGQIDEFPNASSSQLVTIDLSANRLNGSIPKSFFELRKLNVLFLSSNFFTGTIHLESFKNLVNISSLDLSHNNISVDTHSSTSNSSTLPQLSVLRLASCKLQMFPELANQSRMLHLDLSDNQIKGEIPNWIWKVGGLLYLNLSSNLLAGLQQPYTFPSYLLILDLHSNQLHGAIPIPPMMAVYVDYSSNNFNSSIPPDISINIPLIAFFSLSKNRLTGSIPESLCNAINLNVLDFSDNALTGKIPSCLVENNGSLTVLNLARNNLTGGIPKTFPVGNHLRTLDLSSNALEGKIPESLTNCTFLEVLNIGNNKIEDTFPCKLKNSSSLRILVLRSNKLHGDVSCLGTNNSWPELQIIDIAVNNFSGVLSPKFFSGWKRLRLEGDNGRLPGEYLRYNLENSGLFYYRDRVTINIKGLEMELVKILTAYTAVDFSHNKFTGEIPASVGDLRSLYILNLSHNAFTGRIPSSIGNLTDLGSLDLSVNRLSGEIPTTLTRPTFLAFLNLSFNKLSGTIPRGPQFETFTAASYEGNAGLCGYPLDQVCNDPNVNAPSPRLANTPSSSKTEIKWEYVIAAAGFVTGLGTFSLVLLFCLSWRVKYFYCVDQLLFALMRQRERGSIAEAMFRRQPIRRRQKSCMKAIRT